METALSQRVDAFVRRRVASGRYGIARDAIDASVARLDERDRGAARQSESEGGFEQMDRGHGVAWTSEAKERLNREAVDDARRGKPTSDAVRPKRPTLARRPPATRAGCSGSGV